ncbi:MAG TPA: ABC transporter permease [Symbiobacteriaceae bacterium]|nr:ABC transporter permease [Symbiobacteriaceae bacterium]
MGNGDIVYRREDVAALPFQPSRRLPLQHFGRLVRVMLAEYRSMWAIQAFFGFLMPLGMIYLLKYMGGAASPERAIFVLGGNLVSSIAYGPVMFLIGRIGYNRQARSFDYWANLPVAPLTWVLAMSTVSLMLALPGLIAVFLTGSWLLGFPLVRGLAVAPLIPLATLSLTGIGAFLGAYAKNLQVANIMGNAVVGFVSFLSPIMIPLEVMPLPLQYLARLVPTTYAADAFRSALAGNFGPALAYDVLILVLLMAVSLVAVHRRLNWRAA